MSKTTDTWFRILKGIPLTEQKTCMPGTAYNPGTQKCEPAPPSAQKQEPAAADTEKAVPVSCNPGTQFNPKTKRCERQMSKVRQIATKKIQQVAEQPSKGRPAVRLAQSVVGDIIFGDAHLPEKKRKLKVDGLVGPNTLRAFANIGIDPSFIGEDPKDRKNWRMATRNIEIIRKALAKKYNAALPYIGVAPDKALAVAQAVKAAPPAALADAPKGRPAVKGDDFPGALATIAKDASALASIFIPKENPESPPVGRLKSKKPPTTITQVKRGRGSTELDTVMAAAVTKLQQDAVAAGFRLRDFQPAGGISGFRSIEKQKKNWERAIAINAKKGKYGETVAKTIKYEPDSPRPWVAYWKKSGKVFSRSKTQRGALERITRQFVAKPASINKKTGEVRGGSPHMSGRAIDFLLKYGARSKYIKQMKELPEYKWLQQNAAKYGLKQYGAEPWHWEMDETNYEYFKNKLAAAAEEQQGHKEKAIAYNKQAQQVAGLAESKKLDLKEDIKVKISKKKLKTLTETEWWRKRRKKDNKAYNINLGKKFRRMKHVKKGGSYMCDPPSKLAGGIKPTKKSKC